MQPHKQQQSLNTTDVVHTVLLGTAVASEALRPFFILETQSVGN